MGEIMGVYDDVKTAIERAPHPDIGEIKARSLRMREPDQTTDCGVVVRIREVAMTSRPRAVHQGTGRS